MFKFPILPILLVHYDFKYLMWYFSRYFPSLASMMIRYSFLTQLRKPTIFFRYQIMATKYNCYCVVVYILFFVHILCSKKCTTVYIFLWFLFSPAPSFWAARSIHRSIYDLWIHINFFRWREKKFLARTIYRKTYKKGDL